ncbi:MAG: hypothetical protein H8E74_04205 [Gammaproteobacteria bacterium]|nr:hypothetical protein [Gammaproteobacteria bacterium]
MKAIKAGDYIVNKKMRMEGIVLECSPHGVFNIVKVFCTRDKIYPPNIGATITFRLHDSWEIENNREFK